MASSDLWTITNAPAANTAASASQAAPTNASANGQVLRLRALQASLGGTGAGAALLVVRDGPTATGTILAQQQMNIPANGCASVDLTGLDLRASLGNAITVETTSGGGANTLLTVSAQGDLVPSGYPPFQT